MVGTSCKGVFAGGDQLPNGNQSTELISSNQYHLKNKGFRKKYFLITHHDAAVNGEVSLVNWEEWEL